MEIELKYRARDVAPLERLAGLATLGTATLGEPRTVDEVDRYLDTTDGRLASARWAARLRTRDDRTIISLKGPRAIVRAGDPGALHRRPEIEGPATASLDPSDWPHSDARDRLRSLSRNAPLVDVLTFEQRRTEREVRISGEAVGMLSLDRVRVVHEGRPIGELLVCELELRAGASVDPPSLDAMAEALDSVDGLEPDGRTKLELALAMAGIGTP